MFLSANTFADKNNSDFNFILFSLLELKDNQYTYIDSQGKNHTDSLKIFKKLENIYIESLKKAIENKKDKEKHFKKIMFFSFYAYEKNSAAFQEYLSSDLMSVYKKDRNLFLKTLSKFPFLIEANCNHLNSYFGFEGKHQEEKPDFIRKNEKIFSKYLNEKIICIKP